MNIANLKNKIRRGFPRLNSLIGPLYRFLAFPYRFFRHGFSFRFHKWRVQYHQSGLTTDAACEFMEDPRYVVNKFVAIAATKQPVPTGGDWRLYTFCWAAEYAMKIEGDFIECGVNRGLTSRLIVDYVHFRESSKKFYLVDKFEEGDTEYSNSYEDTKNVFAPFKNVQVIKGRVPEILSQVDGKKFAYVHLDMNAVEPEMAAIDFLWDKISKGGIVMLCDYNIWGRKPQRDAWNAWAKTKGLSVLQLPTTQGMIIKP